MPELVIVTLALYPLTVAAAVMLSNATDQVVHTRSC